MADFQKIDLYGTSYTVKDGTARTTASAAKSAADAAKSAADAAKSAADSNTTEIASLKETTVNISYRNSDESIVVTKGAS